MCCTYVCDKSTWKPVIQSSFFLLPAGSNAASSLGFLMVVSRMLTRHQHEPRARLRSATSGTMKRKGAAARTAWQTGQHRFWNARFTAGFAVWQAFPKGLHPIRVFRFNISRSPPLSFSNHSFVFRSLLLASSQLIHRVFSQRAYFSRPHANVLAITHRTCLRVLKHSVSETEREREREKESRC